MPTLESGARWCLKFPMFDWPLGMLTQQHLKKTEKVLFSTIFLVGSTLFLFFGSCYRDIDTYSMGLKIGYTKSLEAPRPDIFQKIEMSLSFPEWAVPETQSTLSD